MKFNHLKLILFAFVLVLSFHSIILAQRSNANESTKQLYHCSIPNGNII